ncbi:MAG: hypothetical protein M3Z64_10565, partial [Verrucomicrobiota bacterium]|nr:hypothetical protein [Verrucomicrobiota bacterium]
VLLAYATEGENWKAFALSDDVTPRKDVAGDLPGSHVPCDKELMWIGWTATFPRDAVPAGARVSAWAVDTDGPALYRLDDKRGAAAL